MVQARRTPPAAPSARTWSLFPPTMATARKPPHPKAWQLTIHFTQTLKHLFGLRQLPWMRNIVLAFFLLCEDHYFVSAVINVFLFLLWQDRKWWWKIMALWDAHGTMSVFILRLFVCSQTVYVFFNTPFIELYLKFTKCQSIRLRCPVFCFFKVCYVSLLHTFMYLPLHWD